MSHFQQKIPTTTITQNEARRFMLAYHGLYPPRSIQGKKGILNYIRQVGSIQFDPINIVGRNPDLVLQSRIKDYRPIMLDELLYEERKLSDGWDKMASIYAMDDWPYFLRRKYAIRNQLNSRRPKSQVIDHVLEEIRLRGPLSSLDIKGTEKIDWSWGPTSAARAALEQLYAEGYLGIDHRVNNRRSFNLIQRLVPADLLELPDPFQSEQEYQDWHILRRVGSMGLVNSKAGDYWHGILGIKSRERNQILQRLLESGSLVSVKIHERPGQTFFIRTQDFDAYGDSHDTPKEHGAAIIAALDNLIWNRGLIQYLFDFQYVWEVYKPKVQREFGYYVLPVVYGDRFIARLEPDFDKKQRVFTIKNWWWEKDFEPDSTMKEVLVHTLKDFIRYLEASQLKVGENLRHKVHLDWIQSLIGKH